MFSASVKTGDGTIMTVNIIGISFDASTHDWLCVVSQLVCVCMDGMSMQVWKYPPIVNPGLSVSQPRVDIF